MKLPVVETPRLLLGPMTEAEHEQRIRDTKDDELKKAFGEMLAGMREHPADAVWYANWNVLKKETGEVIGGIGFRGAPDDEHAVEVGYGIDAEYRNNGYAAEAVNGICRWAFREMGCRSVCAQTGPANEISRKVLANSGFIPAGQGEEGPLFRLNAP